MKKVIILVIDSMGIGAMPDHKEFNDIAECNTIKNVAQKCGGLHIPNMQKMGIGNLCNIMGVEKEPNPVADFGIMKETSKGKCTTTGHWEIAGLILKTPFKTYPNGFDKKIIDEFIEKTGCGGVLANYPASGTEIIEKLHEEHERTKFPIIYTSADSVFQIAIDINVIPLETLYDWCKIARSILVGENNVSRVIARPYELIDGKPKRISKYRRDFSVEPFEDTVLDEVLKNNGAVIGVGKIEDIFVKKGVSHAIHTGSNKEGLQLTLDIIKEVQNLDNIKIKEIGDFDKELIFTNLVDTDMLFGHRNDYAGYGKAIEEIDEFLPKITDAMKEGETLIITADHGCDPTVPGTDHTREMVPVLVYKKGKDHGRNIGITDSFTYVADVVRQELNLM
ncbi:phosphopentomutase [bacterium]|nr:phosphopentomutase [bacterium]